jgi:hypothetical protein
MADYIATTGTITYLRVHERGSKYGPPGDQLDAEVIVKLQGSNDAYGFQLRADADLPVRQAMLDLLRDAFRSRRPVRLEYEDRAGRSNFRVHRLTLQS